MARQAKGIYRRGDSPYWWAQVHVLDRATGQRKRKLISTETEDEELAQRTRDRLQQEADDAAREDDTNAHFTRARAEELVNTLLRWHGIDPMAGTPDRSPTWNDFSQRWIRDLDLMDLAMGTRRMYACHVRRLTAWLEDRGLGQIRLGEIDRERMQDFYRFLLQDEGLRPKTVVNIFKTLRIVFGTAVNDEVLSRNPTKNLRVSKQAKGRQREPFTSDDLQRLLDTARNGNVEHGQEWVTAMLFGLCTGARLGDCARRRWEEVSFDETGLPTVIRFTPEKTRRHGERALLVPLEGPLQLHLRDLADTENQSGPICPDLSRLPVISRGGLSWRFTQLMDAAGINYQTEAPGKNGGNSWRSKSFHSFRATLPSLMAKAEIPPEIRMKILGHTQMATHQLYTHHEEDQLRQALRTALDGFAPPSSG